eukprot:scaffold3031_cov393-Prasinococcus_capsulatus_cf.AAC.7
MGLWWVGRGRAGGCPRRPFAPVACTPAGGVGSYPKRAHSGRWGADDDEPTCMLDHGPGATSTTTGSTRRTQSRTVLREARQGRRGAERRRGAPARRVRWPACGRSRALGASQAQTETETQTQTETETDAAHVVGVRGRRTRGRGGWRVAGGGGEGARHAGV